MKSILVKVIAQEFGQSPFKHGYVFRKQWESDVKYIYVYDEFGERGIYVRDYVYLDNEEE